MFRSKGSKTYALWAVKARLVLPRKSACVCPLSLTILRLPWGSIRRTPYNQLYCRACLFFQSVHPEADDRQPSLTGIGRFANTVFVRSTNLPTRVLGGPFSGLIQVSPPAPSRVVHLRTTTDGAITLAIVQAMFPPQPCRRSKLALFLKFVYGGPVGQSCHELAETYSPHPKFWLLA